jgi:hypothetical protein
MSDMTVQEIIQDVMTSIHMTKKMVEENGKEMEKVKNEYESILQYDTRFHYSDGFWDGFMYGSLLVSLMFGSIVYYLK